MYNKSSIATATLNKGKSKIEGTLTADDGFSTISLLKENRKLKEPLMMACCFAGLIISCSTATAVHGSTSVSATHATGLPMNSSNYVDSYVASYLANLIRGL